MEGSVRLIDGLKALAALADAGDPGLRPEELASAAGLPAHTVPAVLAEMAAAGFVLRIPASGSWQLGPGAARVAEAFFPYAAVPCEALRQLARPAVEQALATSGEAVFLTVRSGHELLYVDAVMPPAAVRMVGRPGDRDLLHATSQGKALLAFLPAERRDEVVGFLKFERVTPHTLTDRRRFLAELDEVRRRGYALQNEEREGGIRAVAAPVLDPGGYPVAAVCLAGPSARLGSGDLEGRLADAVRVAAHRISALVYRNAGVGREGGVV